MSEETQVIRHCDGCKKCCEGWLAGTAHNIDFYPGKPCHFLSNKRGCTIYNNRPDEPCKSYQCEWTVNSNIPEWMKPDEINVIITRRSVNGIEFWDVMEAGSKLDVSVLNWLYIYCINNQQNSVYRINGGFNYIGTDEFIQSYKNAMIS